MLKEVEFRFEVAQGVDIFEKFYISSQSIGQSTIIIVKVDQYLIDQPGS
jgi:hypothetical protein